MKPKLPPVSFHSCLAPKRPVIDRGPAPLFDDASGLEEVQDKDALLRLNRILAVVIALALIGQAILGLWLTIEILSTFPAVAHKSFDSRPPPTVSAAAVHS